MNGILQELLGGLSLEEFIDKNLFRTPFALPGTARRFSNLLSWELLESIVASGYDDCWLPHRGALPLDPALATGRLSPALAHACYAEGRTVLIRHAERAHPALRMIADDFVRLFQVPVDVQLYYTPAGEEGFDWHYDVEDVFVIQSAGEKEFRLRPNSVSPRPLPMFSPGSGEFLRETTRSEIRCLLYPGDWLYIPAGYWHKASALTESAHLSVGALFRPAAARPQASRESARTS